MGKIFRAEEVVKIAEAVKIPDCVVRAEPHSLPESTIIRENSDYSDEAENLSQNGYESASDIEETAEETDIYNDEGQTENEIPDGLYESEYEKLQIERDAIIKQAQMEAAQILEDAQAESRRILEDSEVQAKSVLETAREDGYRAGVQEKQQEIEECMLKINQFLAELKINQEDYFDDYASELRFTALDIAEKLVAQKLEADERVIIPLVRSAVKTLREVNWIKVEVSDKLRDVASELENVLSEAKSSQTIEVELRRDADPGTCVVHTAEGVIVASVLSQVENIREYFGQYKESDENAPESRSF